MSITDLFIRMIGFLLALLGFFLVLSAVGISIISVSFVNPFFSVILGVILLSVGIWVVRGGNITL